MPQVHSTAAQRLLAAGARSSRPAFKHGGLVRGPGSETSDSVDAKLSDGEFVLPADTVRKVGAQRLHDLVQSTHAPSGKSKKRGHFADGGMVTDDDSRRKNSFGDVVAAAQDSNVQQVASAPAPQQPAAAAAPVAPPAPQEAPAQQSPPAQAPGPSTTPPSVPQAGDSSLVNQIPMDNDKQAPKPDGSMESMFNTETGRNLQAIANSVGGLGGALPTVAKTGGAISTWLGRAGSAIENASAATVGAANSRAVADFLPAANATGGSTGNPESKGVVTPDPNVNAPTKDAPGAPGTAPAAPAVNWDRSGMSNAQVGQANPSGRVRMERLADGSMSFSGGNVSGPVSYTDSAGKALAGAGIRGEGFGGFQVAPSGSNMTMDDAGNYAFSTDAAKTSAQAQGQGKATEQAQPQTQAGDGIGVSQRSPAGSAMESAAKPISIASAPVGSGSGNEQRQKQQTQPQAGWSGVIGGDPADERARRERESLMSSLTTLVPGAKGLLKSQRDGLASLINGERQDATSRANIAAHNATQLEVAGMNNAAADNRENMRLGVERGKLSLQQVAAGYQNRSADRLEAAQESLLQAKTPADQRSSRDRLLALMGKSENTKDRFITAGGGTYVQDGQTVKEPTSIYDASTEQWLRPPGQAMQQFTPPPKDKLTKGQVVNMPDGRKLRWNGSAFVPAN